MNKLIALVIFALVGTALGCGGNSSGTGSGTGSGGGNSNEFPPEWYKNLPQDDVYLYAVGRADNVVDPALAEQAAEEQARGALARAIETKVKNEFISFATNNFVGKPEGTPVGSVKMAAVLNTSTTLVVRGSEALKKATAPSGNGATSACALVRIARKIAGEQLTVGIQQEVQKDASIAAKGNAEEVFREMKVIITERTATTGNN